MNRQIDLDQFKKRKGIIRRKRRLIILAALILLLAGSVFAFFKLDFLQVILSPVSFVTRLVNPVELKESDGRVNVLVLGLDTRGSGWSGLTDTILVGSVSSLEGKPALISIPRDFWVRFNASGGGKINTVYNLKGTQSDGKFDYEVGVASAKSKIEEVLGIEIPYWVVVNFEGFKEIIDTLGGIDVTVDHAFQDCDYPTPDYKTKCISFKAGSQVMNGEKALEYARSRMGTNGEGSDFSRTRRQQKVIMAVRDKVLSLNLLLNPGKLSQLYKQVTAAVKTNAGFGEIRRSLEIAAKLEDLSQVQSLVLDPDSGLVWHPDESLFNGAYVIVPKGGDTYYTKIHQAVRNLLFGAPAESVPPQGEKP